MSASSASRRCLELSHLFLRQLAHVGILQQLLGRVDLGDDLLVLAERVDQRLHLRRPPSNAYGTSPCRPGRRGRPSRPSAGRTSLRTDVSLSNMAYLTSTRPETGGRNATSSPSCRRVVNRAYVFVHRARDSCAVVGQRRETPAASAFHASCAVGPIRKLARQLRRAGDLAQPREQPDGYVHARSSATRRAASSAGSAVAPSIQTSPPSKCSCFQIGAICLTRSIA